MEDENMPSLDELAAERIKTYQGAWLTSGVEGAILGMDLHWGQSRGFEEHGDAMLARGSLQLGLEEAIGLAGAPAHTAELAAKKVRALQHGTHWLEARAADAGHRGVISLLAAAASAECERWLLSATGGPSKGEPPVSISSVRVSPPLRRRYVESADMRGFEAIVARVTFLDGDVDALEGRGDRRAVAGATEMLLVAVLQAMAEPIHSSAQLETKRALLEEYVGLLTPAWLMRPMMDAMVTRDCHLVGATQEQVATLRSVLPQEAD